MSANETDFELKLQPYIGGVAYNSGPTLSLTSLTLNTWYEVEFDLSAAPDGWVARLDVWFNPTGGNRDGDVYYIDDLAQALTLSNDNFSKNEFLKISPNPVSKELKLADYQNYKSVTIHNLLGQQVKQVESQKTIDVSDLTSGIYIVNTELGKCEICKRII